MFRNNFRIAVRNLLRNKSQSAILVGGLAAGMTACILLLQYVSFELSFDDFHSKRDRIYRVVNERIQNGKTIQKGTITYPTIGAAMQKDFPEIANHARIVPGGQVFVRYEDQLAAQDGILFADEHFLELFDFPLLAGQGDGLLDETNEMILARSVADQYFPGIKGDYEQVIGKEVFLNTDPDPYTIVGVCENVPANSFLQFNILGSYDTYIRYNGKAADESWTWSDFWHFIELKPGVNPATLEAKLPAFSDRYFRGAEVSGSEEVFTLQALKDAHLYSAGLEYEIGRTANGKAVWSMLIIAFFILIIAWINYVNLSSVRAIERAKEVGVRKVIGARRGALVGQFLTEALVVNLLALLLAWQAAQLLKPWFAANFELESSALRFTAGGNFYLLLTLIGLGAAGVLVSGAYPAWLLSSTHVSSVLKGVFQKKLGGAVLRKALVVFQFTASVALITATWVVARQIRFISRQDPGLDIEQILTVNGPNLTPFDSVFIGKMEALKSRLLANPRIISAATSNRTLDDNWHGRVFRIEKTGDNPSGEQYTSSFIITDYNYAETYGMKPVSGRFFRATDHHPDADQVDKIVVNEAAVKMFGYASAESAVSQTLRFWNKNRTIVGVVPDFHEMSLHHAIEPLIFVPFYSAYSKLSIRVDAEDMEATIGFIQTAFREFFPGNVFEYAFLDESYQRLYEADRRFGRILGFFTLLAILIACLGLFGLASYMTFLRTKEIGIRKVLGASAAGIVTLLSKDFLKLVVLGMLLAAPLAWYFTSRYLQAYPYRINIDWWVFALAGAGAIAVAFLTVGFQSVKAALANPVKSLKSE